MKKNKIFYQLLIGIAICGCMYCGNGTSGDGSQRLDSTTNNDNDDSINAAHHSDPATAYPQPPVTGSNQDSSRTKDSGKLKDTPNRPGY